MIHQLMESAKVAFGAALNLVRWANSEDDVDLSIGELHLDQKPMLPRWDRRFPKAQG